MNTCRDRGLRVARGVADPRHALHGSALGLLPSAAPSFPLFPHVFLWHLGLNAGIKLPKLNLNLGSSCLSFPAARSAGVHHCAQFCIVLFSHCGCSSLENPQQSESNRSRVTAFFPAWTLLPTWLLPLDSLSTTLALGPRGHNETCSPSSVLPVS